MRSFIAVAVLNLCLLGGLVACRDMTGVPPTPAPLQYVPGELLVELHPQRTDATFRQRVYLKRLVPVRPVATAPRTWLVRVPKGQEDFWIAELKYWGIAAAARRRPSSDLE
jgi:hypothetical protein